MAAAIVDKPPQADRQPNTFTSTQSTLQPLLARRALLLSVAAFDASIRVPQIVSFGMGSKRRSPAQLAAAARGTASKKAKARDARISAHRERGRLCVYASEQTWRMCVR